MTEKYIQYLVKNRLKSSLYYFKIFKPLWSKTIDLGSWSYKKFHQRLF